MIQKAAFDIDRRAGMGLGKESDMDVARDQRGQGIGAMDRIEPGLLGQIGDSLGSLGEIEAHIHVPQLVAFPGIHGAAPEFDHRVTSRSG